MSKQGVDLRIPEGITGVALKELMYRFVSFLATINEHRDGVEYRRNQQKVVVDHVKDLAMQGINGDEDLKGLTNPAKASHLHTYSVQHPTSNDKTTYADERNKLMELEFRLARANSRVRELESLIQVCRSGLSYDRNELSVQ